MNKSVSYEIFKNGSTTFFTATLFFPKVQKKAVFDLYAFVRVFDDFVDCIPAKKTEYFNLKDEYHAVLSGQNRQNPTSTIPEKNTEVVRNFVKLQKDLNFDQKWVESFFESMEADLIKTSYTTLQETEHYIYGSAEVIGLMMAKIMKLDEASYPAAQALGKAFQYMNMIRDVADDLNLGRTYLPVEEYEKHGLTEISKAEATSKPEQFAKFIQAQIKIYKQWREQAVSGFHFVPRRYLVPIKIALNLFDDTIEKISHNPQLIFERKVKPSKLQIIATAIKQYIFT